MVSPDSTPPRCARSPRGDAGRRRTSGPPSSRGATTRTDGRTVLWCRRPDLCRRAGLRTRHNPGGTPVSRRGADLRRPPRCGTGRAPTGGAGLRTRNPAPELRRPAAGRVRAGCAATDHALAVLSRGGATAAEMRAVVAVALVPVERALAAGSGGGGRWSRRHTDLAAPHRRRAAGRGPPVVVAPPPSAVTSVLPARAAESISITPCHRRQETAMEPSEQRPGARP